MDRRRRLLLFVNASELRESGEPEFVNLLRSAGIDSQPEESSPEPEYFMSLRIDSKEPIPPGFVARWAGTTTLFLHCY